MKNTKIKLFIVGIITLCGVFNSFNVNKVEAETIADNCDRITVSNASATSNGNYYVSAFIEIGPVGSGFTTHGENVTVAPNSTKTWSETFYGLKGSTQYQWRVGMTTDAFGTTYTTSKYITTPACAVVNPPINGGWSDWGPKSTTECEKTYTQTRYCNNPTPANGGAYCVGSNTQTGVNGACAPTVKLPTVDLNATSYNISYGSSTTLTWTTSNNPTTCSATGGANSWAGSKSIYGGSMATGQLYNDVVYFITCSNSAGQDTDSITIYVGSQPQTKIDGGWSDWGPKSTTECEKTYTQTRYCNNPTPANGGAYCVGSNTRTGTNGACTQNPINGGWSNWSARDYTCGTSGVQTRTCNNPTPQNGGAPCSGLSTQYYTNEACTQNPVNGGWSDWSARDYTCGTSGTQTRTCTNPTPQNGGTYCSGSSTQYYTNPPCQVQNSGPTAITTMATNIGQTSARLNGLGLLNDNGYVYTTGYFEYGTTYGLGSTTSSKYIGSAQSNPFYFSLFNIASGTTYYYRAVVTNQYGTSRGDIVSFRTNNVTVVNTTVRNVVYRNTTVVSNVNDTTVGTSRPSLISLSVSENGSLIQRGNIIEYVTTYKNISTRNLRDVVLRISIPKELEFIETSRGYFSTENNTVVVNIGNLYPNEEGNVRVRVSVTTTAEINKIVVVTANMAYTIVDNNNQEEVFAYAKNTVVDGNVSGATVEQGALAFLFGTGFLPNSLLGWLLLLLLIVLIILAVRKASYSKNNTVIVPTNNGNH